MQDIVVGRYQIVILSPEMLQTIRFRESVLTKQEFTSRVLSVFVDEAHCVSHWGDSFRKKYGTLGTIRAYLPGSTPYIAVSASLTESTATSVARPSVCVPPAVVLNVEVRPGEPRDGGPEPRR